MKLPHPPAIATGAARDWAGAGGGGGGGRNNSRSVARSRRRIQKRPNRHGAWEGSGSQVFSGERESTQQPCKNLPLHYRPAAVPAAAFFRRARKRNLSATLTGPKDTGRVSEVAPRKPGPAHPRRRGRRLEAGGGRGKARLNGADSDSSCGVWRASLRSGGPAEHLGPLSSLAGPSESIKHFKCALLTRKSVRRCFKSAQRHQSDPPIDQCAFEGEIIVLMVYL